MKKEIAKIIVGLTIVLVLYMIWHISQGNEKQYVNSKNLSQIELFNTEGNRPLFFHSDKTVIVL